MDPTVTKPIEFYGVSDVYSESGVDLTLLRENLKRSVDQRLEDNRRGLLLAAELQKSGRAKYPWLRDQPEIHMLDPVPLLRRLNDRHVEYVIIGGVAMIAHGSAHITKDLDVCYSRTPENVASLVAALSPLHPYLRGVPPGLPFHFDVPTVQAGLNFTLVTSLGDFDLLGEVKGVGRYTEALAQSEDHQIGGVSVRVLSLDALIASKKAAGRPHDLNHVLELEELKKLRRASN
jgi:hypothetical protein